MSTQPFSFSKRISLRIIYELFINYRLDKIEAKSIFVNLIINLNHFRNAMACDAAGKAAFSFWSNIGVYISHVLLGKWPILFCIMPWALALNDPQFELLWDSHYSRTAPGMDGTLRLIFAISETVIYMIKISYKSIKTSSKFM